MAKDLFSALTDKDRIERANEKLKILVTHAIGLLNISAQNRIIVYSPTLSSQIPRSRAANAFNGFQNAMFQFEAIRACVLWDKCRSDDLAKVSIPAVVRLIDKSTILDVLQQNTEAFWGDEFGLHQARRERGKLERAIKFAKHQENSPRIRALRNHRDKFIAHSLERTYLEADGEVIAPPKYGYEKRALLYAIAVLHRMYIGVSGKNFDWKDSSKIAKRNAEALWEECTFKIRN